MKTRASRPLPSTRVADRVDVDLGRVVEEAVEQHRRVVRHLHRLAHVALEVALLVDDLHRAAAEHVARPHDERIADLAGALERLLLALRGAVRRLLQAELLDQHLEALAVLGDVDRVGRRPDDRHARGLERLRELQRRLPAVLHDHAERLLLRDDLEHVLERDRLEVQPVARVVVGRDGLGIAVDHDGLVAVVRQRHRGVHAAVVELDALPDPVRAAAEHHDLAAVARLGLALGVVESLVRRVQVRGARRELGRARVDALVDRPHAVLDATLADLVLGRLQQVCEPAVGEAACASARTASCGRAPTASRVRASARCRRSP